MREATEDEKLLAWLYHWCEHRLVTGTYAPDMPIHEKLDLLWERQIAKMESERGDSRARIHELKAKLEASEKAAAAMRKHLEVINGYQARFWPEHGTTSMAIKHALSSDAGRGWLAPELGNELVEAVRLSVVWCDTPSAAIAPVIKALRCALAKAKEAGL